VIDVTPSDEVMRPPRPHFHLYDNGADGVDSSPPSRTWSAEDIIFGGPPTPPLATARDDDPEHGHAWDRDDHDPHTSKGLLPLLQLSHTRRGRRWSAVVTEIADDGDFLRELNRELALATKYFTATAHTSDASGSHGEQEEEGPGGVEVLPRRATMSDDGHGIGKRRNDVQMRMSVSMSTSAQSTQPSLMARPGYDPRMESQRLDKARKAMMCVREIVRTERSYLAHLRSVGEREVSSLFLFHHPSLPSSWFLSLFVSALFHLAEVIDLHGNVCIDVTEIECCAGVILGAPPPTDRRVESVQYVAREGRVYMGRRNFICIMCATAGVSACEVERGCGRRDHLI